MEIIALLIVVIPAAFAMLSLGAAGSKTENDRQRRKDAEWYARYGMKPPDSRS